MRFGAVAAGGVVALALGWLMIGIFNRVAPVPGGAPEPSPVWALSGLALVALVALAPFLAGGAVAGWLSPGAPGAMGAASVVLCALLALGLGAAYLAFVLEAFGPAFDLWKGDPSSSSVSSENLGVAFGQASVAALVMPFALLGGWAGGRLGGRLKGC